MRLKNSWFYSDNILTLIVVILSILSFIMIYSTWSISTVVYGGNTSFGILGKQVLFLLVSIIAYIITMHLPYTLFRKITPVLWLIAVGLLVFVFTFNPINSSRSWIRLPGFNFQPTEFAKMAIIFSLARYYYLYFKRNVPQNFTNTFLKPAILVAVPTSLIIIQPDPGSAVLILFISTVMVFSAGIKFKVIFKSLSKILIVLLFIVVTLFIANTVSDGALVESQSRMIGRFDYTSPCEDYNGDGFQICNSMIAINSGGIIGKGIGESTQKYLFIPESHTDAIISVTSEELGFVTTAGILLLYMILIIIILSYAKKAPDKFASLTCVGIAMLYFSHVFINVAGILNIIPFTGVPLPFYSYGGTFLLLCFASLGVVQSIAISVNRMAGDSDD